MKITNPGISRLFVEGRVIKSTSEIVNNSIVPQNDNELVIPVLANSKYHIFLHLVTISVGNVPDISISFAIPAGATWLAMYQFLNAAGAFTTAANQTGSTLGIWAQAGVENLVCDASLYLITTNAGNFQLLWAQAVAAIENTEMRAGSYLYWRKLI